jgi:hypothetical protein
MLDPATCEVLERDLRETATIVGGARDAEVVQRRIDSLLKGEPSSLEVDQIKRQLAEMLEISFRDGGTDPSVTSMARTTTRSPGVWMGSPTCRLGPQPQAWLQIRQSPR